MVIKSSAFAVSKQDAQRPKHILLMVLKTAVAIGLLATLFYYGNIDPGSILALHRSPTVVATVAVLAFGTVPLNAFRWKLILHALKVRIPFVSLLHIQCIGTAFNQILFGPVSADVVRGLYAWRTLGERASAIAVSLVIDRIIGLIGLLIIGDAVIALRLRRVMEVPELAALLIPFAIASAAFVAVGAAALIAPGILNRIRRLVSGRRRIADLLVSCHDMSVQFRQRPGTLAATLLVTIVGHLFAISALVLIACQLKIGTLSAADYFTASPLAHLVNALPLTPGGLGVGETAFDRICNWLGGSSGIAYASVFFAYRAITTLVFLLGFISFVIYKPFADSKPTQDTKIRRDAGPSFSTKSSAER